MVGSPGGWQLAGAALTPISALYLTLAFVNAAVALFVLFANPRRRENWLIVLILALSAGSVLARAWKALVMEGVMPGDAAVATAIADSLMLKYEWPVSVFVLALALVYPHDRLRRNPALGRGFAAVFVAFMALWAVVVLRAGLVYGGSDSRFASYWLAFLVDDARYFVATAVALALFGHAYATRPRGSADRSAEYMFAAFAIGPLASTPVLLRNVSLRAPVHLAREEYFLVVRYATIAVGAIVVAGVVAWAIWLAHRRGHRPRVVPAWAAAALLLGFVPLADYSLAGSNILGVYGDFVYLLFRPLLLGYAILRYQVLDVDVRLKHGLATVLLILATGAVFLPVAEAVRRYSGLPSEMALSAGVATGFAVTLALFHRVQGFAAGAGGAIMPKVREEDSRYFEERKRELYRVAIERALDERFSVTPRGAEDLTRMRQRLGISAAEHEGLVAEVQSGLKAAAFSGAARPAEAGSVILGRYRVLDLLGEGGSGWTYRCADERLEREVAVKEIDVRGAPHTRRIALREANLLASIRHPRVVSLFDVYDAGARVFLVMELVPGGSVADLLDAEGALAPEAARRVVGDVLEGLEALHGAGLVHRDIKPSNILLEADGGAKLADFGVARGAETVTLTGLRRAGTPRYMAPEQLLEQQVDHRADVYGTAAVLYELLAGEAYVEVAMRQGVLVEEAVVSRPPPVPVAGAPAWANGFLARGLKKDPGLRFQSAGEARAALDAGAGGDAGRRG